MYYYKELKSEAERATMELIAVQKPKRFGKPKPTRYVYFCRTDNGIYYTQGEDSDLYQSMARYPKNMKLYRDVFITPPLTKKEKAWLKRNNYKLLQTEIGYKPTNTQTQFDYIEKPTQPHVTRYTTSATTPPRVSIPASNVPTVTTTVSTTPQHNSEITGTAYSGETIIDNDTPVYSGSDRDWYRTNFVRSDVPGEGNVINRGTKWLWVKIPDAKTYLAGVILHKDSGAVIDTSQSKLGEKPEIRLSCLDRKGTPIASGKYILKVSSDTKTGETNIEDDFLVV